MTHPLAGKKQTEEHIRKRSQALLGLNRRYTINEKAFSVIENEQAAYWLGFLITDGSVSYDGCVRCTLQVGDAKHLESLKVFLGSNAPIKFTIGSGHSQGKEYATLAVYSKRMVSDLCGLGVIPNKTKIVKPWLGPEHLMKHFWRGCVDGDGWVNSNSSGSFTIGLCGTNDLVKGFRAFVEEQTGWSAKVRSISSIFACEYSGVRNSGDVCRLLYGDSSISLDRKRHKASDCMSRLPKRRDLSWVTKELVTNRYKQLGQWGLVAKSIGLTAGDLFQIRKRNKWSTDYTTETRRKIALARSSKTI